MNRMERPQQRQRLGFPQRRQRNVDEGITFSKERVATFGDAVIAIAITLLILDIHPELADVTTSREVWQEMRRILPNLLAFAFSFFVIVRLWIGNQLFFQSLATLDMRTLQYYILFLLVIVVIPVSTGMLASSHLLQAAITIYAGTMAAASIFQTFMWNRLRAPARRTAETPEYFVFVRVNQYAWSAVIFIVSIPLASIHPYVGIGFWILFGFSRLFSEYSSDSLKDFEEVYLQRKSAEKRRRP